MLFGAKLTAARAVGATSRASGRGGGTTLPGRMLLRMAPDAIARLGKRLDRGSTLISATNGKTTTAGMIAAALEADGRHPVHNRAGSNMTWGVATALLEQRGREGLFEVDEAWLPRVSDQLDPSLIVLGNLFRDQLDRYGEMETLAAEWGKTVAARAGRSRFALNADDPAIADLGREESGEAREGVVYFGIEDVSQALPPLRTPLRLRARLRRPSRALRLPQLPRRAPAAGRRRDRDRAARHGRLALADPHSRGRNRAGAADAGALQRLQRPRRRRRLPAPRRRA